MGLFRALITILISLYIVNIISKKSEKYKKYIIYRPINDILEDKYKLLITVFFIITVLW
jgi:hypothetical protein